MAKKYFIIQIIILLLVFQISLFAQKDKPGYGQLSGQVYDKKTGKVIEGVNVLVPLLNIGASSNKYGHYRVKKIPPGIYDFVFSCVGYHTKTTKFEIKANVEYDFRAELEPKEINLNDVEIVAQSPTEWKKFYQTFEQKFLGNGRFSKKCFIRNKEKINFFIDKKTNKLMAVCDTLIRVDNYGLGYHLDVKLKRFEYDYKMDEAKYDFYIMFRSMKSDKINEILNWQKNRIDVFKGTFQHFLSDLAQGDFNKFEFVLSKGKLKDFTKDRNLLIDRVIVNHGQYLATPGTRKDYCSVDYIEFDDLGIFMSDEGKFIWPINECYKVISTYSSRNQEMYVESKTKQLVFDYYGHILNPNDIHIMAKDLVSNISDLLPQDYLSR